jgi:hypothetical protein
LIVLVKEQEAKKTRKGGKGVIYAINNLNIYN